MKYAIIISKKDTASLNIYEALNKLNFKENIVKELKNIENINITILLQSHWDLEIDIWAKKTSNFHDFYNNIIEKYSDFIQNKEFSLITKIHHLKHPYLYKKQEEIILGESKKEKIDETDYKILKLLEEDGRQNIIELSKTLSLPPTTLNYRLKNLKSKVVKTTVPILNIDLIGYDTHKIQITLNNTSKKTTLIKYLSTKKNITKIYDLIGKVDLEFEVDFKTSNELDDFLTELRIKIPYIKDFEVITVAND